MKMTIEHYTELKVSIAKIPEDHFKKHKQFIIKEGKAIDINKRLRWDCFWFACKNECDLSHDLYEYLNDDHVDTALKKIIKDLFDKA